MAKTKHFCSFEYNAAPFVQLSSYDKRVEMVRKSYHFVMIANLMMAYFHYDGDNGKVSPKRHIYSKLSS